MERFFGGNPALVLLRLVILSLIVGVVLAALGFSPFEIIDSMRGWSSASMTWASPPSRRRPLLPARRGDRVPRLARGAAVEIAGRTGGDLVEPTPPKREA